jgi:hypothetical protein
MAMNKKDAIPFAVLLALLLAWPYVDRIVAEKFFPDHVAAQPASVAPAVGPEEAEITAPTTPPAAVCNGLRNRGRCAGRPGGRRG